jgi:hypothetical protein
MDLTHINFTRGLLMPQHPQQKQPEQTAQDNAAYVQGQIRAVRALVIALAKTSGHLEAFCAEAQTQMELLRTAVLHQSVPESYLDAIAETEAYVQEKCAARRG